MAALARRVRALEARLDAPPVPVWNGPRLTPTNVGEQYDALRRRAVRFVVLRVHPSVADLALELTSETTFRALQRIEQDDSLPRDGWELVPA